MGEDHEDYSSFLFNLSQQLSVEECGDLAFLAGLAKQTVALCPGHLHCVCTGHGVDATMPCSPTLAQLRRLEKAEVFNQGDLTKLAEILDRIGRKDLATRCTDAAEFPHDHSQVAVEESGRGTSSHCITLHPKIGDLNGHSVQADKSDLVNSCPSPMTSTNNDTLPCDLPSTLTSSAVVLSQTSVYSSEDDAQLTNPTASCPASLQQKSRVTISMTHCSKIRKFFNSISRSPKRSPASSGATTPQDLDFEYVDVGADVTPPLSTSPSLSGRFPAMTMRDVRSSSSTSRESSPLCDISICSLSPHPTSPTPDSSLTPCTMPPHCQAAPPSHDKDAPTGKFPVKGASFDVPGRRPVAKPPERSQTVPEISVSCIKSLRPYVSDSKCSTQSTPNSPFLWKMKLSDLRSKIKKRKTAMMERKFTASTQMDKNNFMLQCHLKLYPLGLDFDQDKFCTLMISMHSKGRQSISSQKIKVDVRAVAGDMFLKKEEGFLCKVGETRRMVEFLSHDVLSSCDADLLELTFNLHLEYEFDNTWVYIDNSA